MLYDVIHVGGQLNEVEEAKEQEEGSGRDSDDVDES